MLSIALALSAALRDWGRLGKYESRGRRRQEVNSQRTARAASALQVRMRVVHSFLFGLCTRSSFLSHSVITVQRVSDDRRVSLYAGRTCTAALQLLERAACCMHLHFFLCGPPSVLASIPVLNRQPTFFAFCWKFAPAIFFYRFLVAIVRSCFALCLQSALAQMPRMTTAAGQTGNSTPDRNTSYSILRIFNCGGPVLPPYVSTQIVSQSGLCRALLFCTCITRCRSCTKKCFNAVYDAMHVLHERQRETEKEGTNSSRDHKSGHHTVTLSWLGTGRSFRSFPVASLARPLFPYWSGLLTPFVDRGSILRARERTMQADMKMHVKT